MDNYSRRAFIQCSSYAALAGTGLGSVFHRAIAAPAEKEPHFFILYFLNGGWDGSYLTDARELKMTQAGLMHNYIGEDPGEWAGSNGVSTLATSLAKPFEKFFNDGRLSIINGCFMSASFDGHEQNKNFLLSGNPFGGNVFLPYLNKDGRPIDALQLGSLFGVNITNGERIINLKASSINPLAEGAKDSVSGAADPDLNAYLRARYSTLKEQSELALGAGGANLLEAAGQIKNLRRKLALTSIDGKGDEFDQSISGTIKYFSAGLTSSSVIVDKQYELDTHDVTSAKTQPMLYKGIGERIGKLFSRLEKTEYKSTGKSYLDFTTVMVMSEFGRTMRQSGSSIDATGTDHNTLSNSIIVGGKGIRGGMVVGQSDYRSAGEVLSGAHKQLDRQSLKLIGKPFDPRNLMPVNARPDEYKPEEYLNYTSVANSLMHLFGVPKTQHLELVRNGPSAPILDGLLT